MSFLLQSCWRRTLLKKQWLFRQRQAFVRGQKDKWRPAFTCAAQPMPWPTPTPQIMGLYAFLVFKTDTGLIFFWQSRGYRFFWPISPAWWRPAAELLCRWSTRLAPVRFFIFLKLRYKGKSFRWHHRRNALVLKFGTSHLVACPYPGTVRRRRVAKTKIIFFGTHAAMLCRLLHLICAWRPVNIYNARGLRFARQLVARKHGKVSTYR